MLSRFSPVVRSTLARRGAPSMSSTTLMAGSMYLASRPSPSASFQRRGAANQMAAGPGSNSAKQAGQNLKEELGEITADAARMIGANPSGHESSEFKQITQDIAQTVPKPVLLWGLAGTVPYAASAVLTAYTARNASLIYAAGGTPSMDLLASLQTFQITYGAVMLSFLGACHWGFEFAKFGGEQGHKRLAFGTAPLLVAWPTLYLADPSIALIAQWTGFLASWVGDRWATSEGWVPEYYGQYRFYLTLVAGGSIMASLIATNHYSVDDEKLFQEHSDQTSAMAGLNTGGKTLTQKQIDELPVKFEADKSGESYGKISKKVSPEEKKEKEEAKAKAEKEAKEAEKKKKEEKK